MPNANLRTIVRGAYDVQKLRIQMGNRIVGNFKVKLGQAPGQNEEILDPESKALLAQLRETTKRVTDTAIMVEDPEDAPPEAEVNDDSRAALKAGKLVQELIIRRYNATTESRKRFPTKAQFHGDSVISDYTELCLIGQYVDLMKHEEAHFRRLGEILKDYVIFNEWLGNVRGVGPAMAGVVLSEIDIAKARYPSSLWAYAGLDVAPDGAGRSRRKEHLVARQYTDKDGKPAERQGITFNPFLKTKLVGVLASSFLRCGDNPYKTVYDDYKHRLENHAVWGIVAEPQRIAEAKEKGHKYSGKSKRHHMAMRYMIKRFLVDLYCHWRKIEGLPVAPEYSEAKLGMKHVA